MNTGRKELFNIPNTCSPCTVKDLRLRLPMEVSLHTLQVLTSGSSWGVSRQKPGENTRFHQMHSYLIQLIDYGLLKTTGSNDWENSSAFLKKLYQAREIDQQFTALAGSTVLDPSKESRFHSQHPHVGSHLPVILFSGQQTPSGISE